MVPHDDILFAGSRAVYHPPSSMFDANEHREVIIPYLLGLTYR